MSNNRPSDPQAASLRLIEAADELLRAEARETPGERRISLWNGHGARPPHDAFTADEWVEAMAFLVRLGILTPMDGPEDTPEQR